MQSLQRDRNPNLFVLQYSESWRIENLRLVPRAFFSESIIECRKPLGAHARRAGWIGCNIILKDIPADGKIDVIEAGQPVAPQVVRQKFTHAQQLANVSPKVRGWTLDVLSVVRGLRKEAFLLSEIYKCEGVLVAKHPGNRHVREKIRQQLQVLRDHGFLEFVGKGRYRIVSGRMHLPGEEQIRHGEILE